MVRNCRTLLDLSVVAPWHQERLCTPFYGKIDHHIYVLNVRLSTLRLRGCLTPLSLQQQRMQPARIYGNGILQQSASGGGRQAMGQHHCLCSNAHIMSRESRRQSICNLPAEAYPFPHLHRNAMCASDHQASSQTSQTFHETHTSTGVQPVMACLLADRQTSGSKSFSDFSVRHNISHASSVLVPSVCQKRIQTASRPCMSWWKRQHSFARTWLACA